MTLTSPRVCHPGQLRQRDPRGGLAPLQVIWIVHTIHASQKVPAGEQLRGALGSVLSASLTAPAHRYGGCGSGLRAPLPRGVVKRGRCALPLRQWSRTDGRGPECVQADPLERGKCRRLFVTVTFQGMTEGPSRPRHGRRAAARPGPSGRQHATAGVRPRRRFCPGTTRAVRRNPPTASGCGGSS